MRKVLVVCLLFVIATAPMRAQIPVTDVASLTQIISIVRNVRETINLMREELQTIQRLARGYGGSLLPYRLASLPGLNHNVGKYDYARLLLEALNTGDPRGEKYTAVVRQVMRPGGLFDTLPPNAKRIMEASFAGIELADSIATMGIHESAQARGYAVRIAALIERLQNDVVAPGSEFHQVTAIADKLALAELGTMRGNQDTNQILNTILEQQLSKNVRIRETAATQMNRSINTLTDGDRSSDAIFGGADDAIRTWRIR